MYELYFILKSELLCSNDFFIEDKFNISFFVFSSLKTLLNNCCLRNNFLCFFFISSYLSDLYKSKYASVLSKIFLLTFNKK